MAIASGPRVCLYGGTTNSSLARALARGKDKPRGQEHEQEQEEPSLFGTQDKSVKPDRTLALGGHPAHHSSYHRDGRLLVVGCDHGILQICDSTSRATLRTFKTHSMNDGFPIRSVGWIDMPDPDGRNKGKKMVWSAGDDAILRVWDLSGDLAGIGDGTKPLLMMKGHGDAIRSVVAYKIRNEKGNKGDDKDKSQLRLVTGSYDHTIRIWDCDGLKDGMTGYDDDDRDRCLSVMDHGAPVETLLVLEPIPGSAFDAPIVISAGGTGVKLWDPKMGTCLSTIRTKHSKTITSLCMVSIIRGFKDGIANNNGDKEVARRLITAGLDGLIRIHSFDELFDSNAGGSKDKKKKNKTSSLQFPYVHGVKTALPITALAMSPDCTRLVIGTSTGLVTVKHRAKYVAQGLKRKAITDGPKAGTYAHFMRGANAGADADDHIVQTMKKTKLRSFDVMLQKFRYGDALDEALAARDPRGVSSMHVLLIMMLMLILIVYVCFQGWTIVCTQFKMYLLLYHHRTQIIAVLEELGRRRGLVIALSNRDEETLEPLLSFTATFISNPKYTPVLTGVANLLCDIYADVIGQSDNIDEYFGKLHGKVGAECRTQSTLNQLIGQIDAVMYAAEVAEDSEDQD